MIPRQRRIVLAVYRAGRACINKLATDIKACDVATLRDVHEMRRQGWLQFVETKRLFGGAPFLGVELTEKAKELLPRIMEVSAYD